LNKEEQYLDALREVVRQGTTGVAVFAIPLGLLLTQLRLLLAIDHFFIKLLSTVSLLAFATGVVIAFITRTLSEQLLAKEMLIANGNNSGKGFEYLRFMEKLWSKSGQDISEQGLISNAKKVQKPIIICLVIGYGTSVLLILFAIWSPANA
jgi:hypothetical protein